MQICFEVDLILKAIANDHEERIRLLEETQRDLAQTSAGLARLLSALDEDRPTILRRLMAIKNKVDTLIERNQYQLYLAESVASRLKIMFQLTIQ